MRNLLAFLAALVLTLAGVGWYLDWYKIQSAPTSDGHRNVNIDIDTQKIGEDLKRGEEKVLEKGEKALREKLDTGKTGEGAKRVQNSKDTGNDAPRE